jgi:hypothetical protein
METANPNKIILGLISIVVVGCIAIYIINHFLKKPTSREGYFRDPYPVGISAYQCYKNTVKRGFPHYKMCDEGDTCNNMGKCCNSGKECSPTTNYSCDENYFVRTY